jgi:hypothetical protein
MRKMRNPYKIFVGNCERDHLEELGIDRRMLLRWFLRRQEWCGFE